MGWDIAIGEVLARRAVHERFGGSRQNGMTRAGQSDDLLLFSSTSGLRYGYNFDGWRSDGAFHYTGEGQTGDQAFTRGNAALRDHVRRGLRPRLFEEVKRSIVQYLGEFQLAADQSYYVEEARDRERELRKVIVFRLLPVTAQAPPGNSVPNGPPANPIVSDVSIEAHVAETFQSEPKREPTTAERREAALVQRYSASLTAAGAAITRKRICLPDLGHPLYTDLYDSTRRELVEAKGSASRHHVRLAIGQLYDYGRHVEHKSLAILLPSDPGADLVGLLHSLGITCVHETETGNFERHEPMSSGPLP
jgi:hypothetical protein